MEGVQIDSIVKIAETIDKFGASVIGLAAFILVALGAIFFIFTRQKKLTSDKDSDFQKMFSEMQQQNQQVFAQLLQSAFKPNQQELVQEGIAVIGVVQEELKQVAAITKGDRVSVYTFHNGQRMLNGRHMIKFSCYTEFAMLSKFTRISGHKDVQVSRIQDLCNVLLSDHRWEALTQEELKDTQLSLLEGLDVKSAFAQLIYSSNGAILGFVLLEYLLTPIEPSWVESARSEVKKLSDKVSLVLDIEMK